MFGNNPFYFNLIRKYVILMGTLLNNIHITKTDKTGSVVGLTKVPITYGPKDKMLARVFQDPNIDRPDFNNKQSLTMREFKALMTRISKKKLEKVYGTGQMKESDLKSFIPN